MADALRLSCSSVRCFSSLFTSFSSSFNNSVQLAVFPNENLPRGVSTSVSSAAGLGGGSSLVAFAPLSISPRKSSASLKVNAGVVETDQPKWWEKNAGPNMIDIHSTQDFLSALSQAGDKLVIVEFYGTWCASCRALFPKLCRTAQEHPEILFLKVNFDENKPMCKNLNVKVLPYFHFYRGADGRVDAFSCSLAKFQKIKDAIQLHNTGVHNIIGEDVNGMPKSIEDLRAQLIGQDQSTTDSSTT